VIVQRRKDQANIEMHFGIISQTLEKCKIDFKKRGEQGTVGKVEMIQLTMKVLNAVS
jgi:hypothetical protein